MSHKNSKIKVGISCGDPNGIGLEALADALSDERSLSSMIAVVFAPRVLAEAAFTNVAWSEVDDAKSAKSGQIHLVTFAPDEFEHARGEGRKEAGAVAMKSLEMAVGHLAKTAVDVLVTAPINKDTIRQAGFAFPGHTEYLASEAGVKDVLMLLCCDGLRIGMVTGHVALKDVASNLSVEAIVNKLTLMNDSLIKTSACPARKSPCLG